MFIAVSLTITAMVAMMYAKNTASLHNWAKLAVKMDGLLPLSVFVIFLPALYLVITTWGWRVAWIDISLAALLIMTFMGPPINLRKLKEIVKVAENETSLTPSPSLINCVRDQVLWSSVIIMTILAVAIGLLMTVKLALVGSNITLIIAIIIGFIIASTILRKTVVVT